MPGIEPGASHMQSVRSTTELHPQSIHCPLVLIANFKLTIFNLISYQKSVRYPKSTCKEIKYSQGIIDWTAKKTWQLLILCVCKKQKLSQAAVLVNRAAFSFRLLF